MESLVLEELSATTAPQANSLELLPGQEQFVTPITYEHADSSLDLRNTWSRVITSGDEVVGFIRAHFDSEHPQEALRCCVWRVSVAANAQGQGVGRFAIGAAKDEAVSRGFTALTAVFSADESGPAEFFHHLGFVATGVTDYGDQVAALEL
jgi:diamine N-acetyltransferase